MKNCIVKMVVKNKNKANPEDINLSDIHQENSLNQTLNRSKTSEQKDSTNMQLKNLLLSFQKIMKSVSKPTPVHQIQPRDRKIVFELPEVSKEQKISKRQLETWITNLCKQVFSTAFHYYEKKNMSYDQTKIYCSQNFISNIIRLNQIYSLNSDEIKMIDEHINGGVTEYLLTKYPMTQINIANKALEASVKQTDNIEALQNDIFFYSEDSFGFEYRETGNYNDLIMKMMNYLMSKTDEQDSISKVTLYQGFYEFMQKSFELIQSRDFMDGVVNPNNNSKAEDLNKKVEDEKYKSRVKAYTSWLIGRKISENVSQYTQAQISSMHMPIKSPAILRILTKWCQQLWAKFNKKNYFLERTENVKCQKGKNVNTYFAWMKTIINDMIEEEKIQIQKYMDQLFENNYNQQETHFHRSLKGNYFNHVEKYEKAAGIFTINIVNNLHSYILLYLNRLIHGLLKVSKRVYDKELIGRARWNSPPNLISFKIGDLMRCKIGSQEKEILKLFRFFNELNEKEPQKFKIIRIKNRLKQGTNDILMNIRYKDTFICQIQLGVNSDHSNFIKCSNKYNHFIYQVKRSIFGPITQFCSIWKSLDGRCKIYQKMAVSKKQQTSRQLKNICEQNNKVHSMIRYNQPFVCSKCHQTYSHSNYIWSHQKCQKCCVYTLCCKCRIDNEDQKSLKNKLFKNNDDLKALALKMKDNEQIPQYGVCFSIQSKYIYLQKFVKWSIKGKVGLFYRKGKDIDLITELNTKKEIEAFKDQYVIFKLPIEEGIKIVRITELQAKNEYLLPKLVKSIYKKQKEFISLIGEDIDDTNIGKILDSELNNRNKIKFLELPDNGIIDISFICDKFRNLTKLVLSRNKIKTIDQIQNLINLEQLNIRDNLIEELPASLFKLFKLQSLNIRNNKFSTIPEQISKLTNLTKIELNQLGLKQLPSSLKKMNKLSYIDLTRNKLGVFPEELKTLKALYHIGLSSNGIEVIPNWIGDLKQLKILELNKNKLKELPASLSQLSMLAQLQIDQNLFEELSFICPQSINVILANNNKIKDIDQNFFVKCQNLAKIELNNNQVTSLPKNFGIICPKMKNLSLNSNKLTDLPNLFGIFLPSIELLELNNNQIKTFPKALKKCSQLVELHLSGNPLEGEVSEEFLQNNFEIQKFDFSRTKICKLPNLSLAPSLKRLNFSQTSLKCKHLQVLKGLQYAEQLLLCKMNLKQLPQSLKQLHYLHILDVSNNQLQALQDDLFTKLTHLRQLTLDHNNLQTLPSSIKLCKRIKSISCEHNKFTSIPEVVFSLNKIQKLSFSSNQITNLQTKLPLPTTIKQLKLSKNKIVSISNAFFKDSHNLKLLDLSDNLLTSAPRSLRECFKLSDVNFNGNNIVFDVFETTKEIFEIFAPVIGADDDEGINDRYSLLNSFLI